MLAIIYFFVINNFIDEISGKDIIKIIIIALLFFIPMIFNIFKNIINFLNFNIFRQEDYIRINYGVFTNYDYKIPFEKINAVIIYQSFLARIFGKYYIEIINAGVGNDKDEKRMITLYTSLKNKNKILDNLLPEYNFKYKNFNQSVFSIIISFFRLLLLIVSFVILSIFYNKLFIFCSLAIIIYIILSLFSKKISYNDKFIVITKGIFVKKISIVKFEKIQLLREKNNILSKLFNISRISFNIIGILGDNNFTSGYFNKKVFKQIENSFKITY